MKNARNTQSPITVSAAALGTDRRAPQTAADAQRSPKHARARVLRNVPGSTDLRRHVRSRAPLAQSRQAPPVAEPGASARSLDKLCCPFVTTLKADVAALEARCVAWAQRFGLLTPAAADAAPARLEFVRLAALVHPDASPEKMELAATWFTWLFLLDDERDESALGTQTDKMSAAHARYMQILRGEAPAAPRDRFDSALLDLRERLTTHGTPATLRRFTESVERYFAACVWEAGNRRDRVVPAVRTYQAMRLDTGAVYTCLDLIGLVGGFELPQHVHAHAAVRELTRLTNRIVCWCNDLLSVSKELRCGDVHNLVLVLQHEGRLGFQSALDRAVAIHNEDVQEFLTRAAALPAFGGSIDADLARYVDGLRTWIRGNYVFSLTAARYQGSRA